MEIFVISSKTKHSVFSLNHLVAVMFVVICYVIALSEVFMYSTEDPVLDLNLLSCDLDKND